jgi:hypothetical protein
MSSSAQDPRQKGGPMGAPPDPTQPREKRRGLWWKVLAVLGLVGAGCASASFIMSLLVVGTLSVGVASCTSSCSDNPIGDSKADAVFIASLDATSRDVETFDALRGAMDSLYESQREVLASKPSLPQTPDELRAAVRAWHATHLAGEGRSWTARAAQRQNEFHLVKHPFHPDRFSRHRNHDSGP